MSSVQPSSSEQLTLSLFQPQSTLLVATDRIIAPSQRRVLGLEDLIRSLGVGDHSETTIHIMDTNGVPRQLTVVDGDFNGYDHRSDIVTVEQPVVSLRADDSGFYSRGGGLYVPKHMERFSERIKAVGRGFYDFFVVGPGLLLTAAGALLGPSLAYALASPPNALAKTLDSGVSMSVQPGGQSCGAPHKVRSGEWLYGIIRLYDGIPSKDLNAWINCNPYLRQRPNYVLHLGDMLRVPGAAKSISPIEPKSQDSTVVFTSKGVQVLPQSIQDSIVYKIQPGDTLFSLAHRYNTTVGAIARANGLININSIYAGRKLIIPLAGPIGGPVEPTVVPPTATAVPTPEGFFTEPYPCNVPYEIRGYFDHLRGQDGVLRYDGDTTRITNPAEEMGVEEEHNGIDWKAPYGSPVVAMASGEVEYVGIPETALLVRINHGELIPSMPGWDVVTIYGHLSKAEFPNFEYRTRVIPVERGQKIGETGNSGTGWTHLHVTVGLNKSGVGFRIIDPFAVTYPSEDPLEKVNLWTVYNKPVCPR